MADKEKKEIVHPKELGAREIPNWLDNYLAYTDGTEAPQEFHLWTGISILSGALGRKCWIDMGNFSIFPSFYIIFVAPPGVATKSTTAGIGIKMLEATKACDLFQGTITWQAVLDGLAAVGKQVAVQGSLLEMSNLHVFASELGTLLKKDDSSMVDTLVDIWDGKDRLERRTRGGGLVTIPRPLMNLIGCTTPAWLNDYAKQYIIDGGFFSRAVFVYGDKKSKLIAYPTGFSDVELRSALERDLARIAQLRGEFRLTPDAINYGTAWYDQLWNNTPEHLAGDAFASYRSRRQAHLHKVAMVVSASQRTDMLITEADMVIADKLLRLSERNLSKVHDAITANDKVAAFKKICSILETRRLPIKKQALFQLMSSQFNMMEFEQAVQAVVYAGFVKMSQTGSDTYLCWK